MNWQRFLIILLALGYSTSGLCVPDFWKRTVKLSQEAFLLEKEYRQLMQIKFDRLHALNSGKPKTDPRLQAQLKEMLRRREQILKVVDQKIGNGDTKGELQQLSKSFDAQLNNILDRLQTSSAKNLKAFKESIEQTMKAVEGTADADEEILREKGESPFHRLDPTTFQLIQAHILAGETRPVLDLFDLLVGNVRLIFEYLNFAHLRAALEPQPTHVTWDGYIALHDSMENAVELLRMVFPAVPEVMLDHFFETRTSQNGPEGFQKILIDSKVRPLVTSFQDARGLFPVNADPDTPGVSVVQRVTGTFYSLVGATDGMRYYRQRFFPALDHDLQQLHLGTEIFNIPNAQECVMLSQGLTSFSQCPVNRFKERLVKYIQNYEQLADHGLIQWIAKYIVQYQDGDMGEGEKALETLKQKLESLSNDDRKVRGDLKDKWKQAVQFLFSKDKDAKEIRIKMILQAELTGFDRVHYLKTVLLHHGIGVIQIKGQTFAQVAFDENHLPEVNVARDVLEGFEINVEKPLRESVLKNSADLLSTVEKSIGRVDSRLESCPLYLDEKKDGTPKSRNERYQDRVKSPWVVASQGYAVEARGSDAEAKYLSGVNAGQRMQWMFKGQLVNAVANQRILHAPETLAGLGVQTALHLMLPNIVHTRLLLGKKVGEDLASLGVQESLSGEVGLVEQIEAYSLPVAEEIIWHGTRAFRKMLNRYALKNNLLEFENEDPSDEEKYQAFEAQYEQVLDAFQENFRHEMHRAALAVRDWSEKLDSLKKHDLAFATGDVSDEETNDSLNAIFGPQREVHADTTSRQANHALITMHQNILLYYYTKTKKMSTQQARARIARSNISSEEWLEAVRLHGEAILGEHMWQNTLGAHVPAHLRQRDDRRPLRSVKWREYVKDIHDRKRDYMQYYKGALLYRFPALKLRDAWKWYNGSPAHHQKALKAYLNNGVKQANKFQSLETSDEILDELVPNLALMDSVLRKFPDQKRQHCIEVRNRNITERRLDVALNSVAIGGAVLACTPIAPVGGAMIAVGTFAATAAQGYRAYLRYYEARSAELFSAAAQAQSDSTQMERNNSLESDLYGRFGNQLAWALVDAAFAAAAGAKNAKSLVQLTRRVGTAGRSAGLSSLRYAHGFRRSFGNAPWRNLSKLQSWKLARNHMLSPLRRWNIAQKWAKKRFWQRFHPYLTLNSLPNGRLQARFVKDMAGYTKDHVFAFPLNLLGHDFGSGRVVSWGFRALLWGGLASLSMRTVGDLEDQSLAKTMSRVEENPRYSRWLRLERGGITSRADRKAMVLLDDTLREQYREDWVKEVTQLQAIMDEAHPNKEAAQNIINNFKQSQAEIEEAMNVMENGDPDYWVYFLNKEDVEEIINRWSRIVEN